ncbi:hypothetical protein SpCBS45565_g04718 [Spizellomyces sp. 'palustris']|nr:hypothetical protein SpCBS45565_g04718 [Spizellomyces sp. 'palustris']
MEAANPPGMKPLAAISLTHVEFDPNDPYGQLMGYASLVPIALLVSYCTLIAFRRDLATCLMFLGQLVNEAVNYAAKKIIKEARPTEYLGKGYGMPSSHSQFVAFFAIYITIYSFKRLNFRHTAWKLLISATVFALAGLVAYSRIHLTYHTPKQVAVGLLVGTGFAFIWFLLVENVFVSAIDLDTPVARWFLVRDTRSIPNILVFEYEKTMKELDARQGTRKERKTN